MSRAPERRPAPDGRRRAGSGSRCRSRYAALARSIALLCVALAPHVPTRAAPHVPLDAPAAMEAQTFEVLALLADGDLARAAPLARALTRRFPDFALARLLHAELESVEALDPGRLESEGAWSRALIDLLAQARARLELGAPTSDLASRSVPRPDPDVDVDLGAAPAPDGPAPDALVALGDDVDHAVLVDLSRNELMLFARGADGHPHLIERHYAASGSGGFGKRAEGDLKTPLGVYRVTAFRPDARLPPLYGSGALTLDYPNALDDELGRTGSGIWLHGVPRGGGSRAPRSSEGCVTMPNARLDALVARLDRSRTVVVLADSVRWTTPRARLERRARHLAALGRPDSARPTLIEVPGTTGAPYLAVSDGNGAGDDAAHGNSDRDGPALRFVPVEPALQASLGVSP